MASKTTKSATTEEETTETVVTEKETTDDTVIINENLKGKKTSTPFGTVEFDKEGKAKVDAQSAKFLLGFKSFKKSK